MIVGRKARATRQLARRARRRVRGAATVGDAERTRQREVVEAFLAAARGGDFAALLAVLDPDVVVRADRAAVLAGASREVRGAAAVAKQFWACPGSTERAGERSRGSRRGETWTAAPRPRSHGQARQDRRDRCGRRPRAPAPARPGGLGRLTSQPTLRLGSASRVPGRSGTARSALARMSAPFCAALSCRHASRLSASRLRSGMVRGRPARECRLAGRNEEFPVTCGISHRGTAQPLYRTLSIVSPVVPMMIWTGSARFLSTATKRTRHCVVCANVPSVGSAACTLIRMCILVRPV